MEELQTILKAKFEEIQRRIALVLEQLDDDQVNWRPDESSNSIANLVVHICANVGERIRRGMNGREYIRERDAEFAEMVRTKNELLDSMAEAFDELMSTLERMDAAGFRQTQLVRGRERTHLDMFVQCAAHFSEHMGQICYIGKMVKGEEYRSTTIPKKKPASE